MPMNHEIYAASVAVALEQECQNLMEKHGVVEEDAFQHECSDCNGLPCLKECPFKGGS